MYDLGSQLLNINKSVCIGNKIVYRISLFTIARFGFFKLSELFCYRCLLRFVALRHLIITLIRDTSADIILVKLLNNAVKLVYTLACFDDLSLYRLELFLILVTLLGTSFLIEHLGFSLASSVTQRIC